MDKQHENRYYNLRYKAFILDHNKNISAAFSQENKPEIFRKAKQRHQMRAPNTGKR